MNVARKPTRAACGGRRVISICLALFALAIYHASSCFHESYCGTKDLELERRLRRLRSMKPEKNDAGVHK